MRSDVSRTTHKQSFDRSKVVRNKLMNKVRLLETRLESWPKVTHNNKVLTSGTYAPVVARLEAIRILLAFDTYKNIKLFQMDVKSTFLNGFIKEEVYMEQPPLRVLTSHNMFTNKIMLCMVSNKLLEYSMSV